YPITTTTWVTDDLPLLVLASHPVPRLEPRRRPGARVPAYSRCGKRALAHLGARLSKIVGALGVGGGPLGCQLAFHRLDQRREGRLRIGADRDVGLGEALEVLIVGADVKITDAEVDHFGAGLETRCARALRVVDKGIER